jgi:hypothetical protein
MDLFIIKPDEKFSKVALDATPDKFSFNKALVPKREHEIFHAHYYRAMAVCAKVTASHKIFILREAF